MSFDYDNIENGSIRLRTMLYARGESSLTTDSQAAYTRIYESRVNYSSYPTNVVVEFGDHSSTTIDKLNYTANIDLNITEFHNASGECASESCNEPVYISWSASNETVTKSQVEVLNITVNYTIQEIDLNISTVNLTDSTLIPFNITADQWGNLTFDDLDLDYYGSIVYNVSAYYYGDATYDASVDWQLLSVVWSNVTLTFPDWIDDIVFYPKTNESLNVTPWSQTSSIPIFNITNHSYHGRGINVSFNLEDVTSDHYPLSDANLLSAWWLDGDANDATGTWNGSTYNTTSTPYGIIGSAYEFDGSADNITIIDNETNEEFETVNLSVSVWAKLAANHTPSGTEIIVSKYATSAGWWLSVNTTRNPRVSWVNSSGVGGQGNLSYSIDMNNSWTHIVFTHDNSTGNISFYINGNYTASIGNMYGLMNVSPVSGEPLGNLTFGSLGASNYFNGTIDEVYIFNKTLTASEVHDLYDYGLYKTGGCINLTVSADSDKLNGTLATHYNQTYITNLTNSEGLWMWSDYMCSQSRRYFNPYWDLRVCCADCVACW